ncbi:hypothetical protein AAKU55_003607 [Oxalobacteraceae bacterium GrIS 1.11]
MNKALLKKRAGELQANLASHAQSDQEAGNLLAALTDLIAAALAESLDVPVEWASVPGVVYFTEGSLAKYVDLETAYANFKIEISGGEPPVLRQLRLKMAAQP